MPVVRPVEPTEEAFLEGSCKVFLLESEGRAGGGFGVVVVPAGAGRDARKGGALVSPKDGVERGVYVVLTLILPYKSRPCNSFSASIAN